MCQNLVSVGIGGEKIIFLVLMFFQQNKFDKYLNHLEMKPRQVPVKSNGTFAMSYVRIQRGEKRPFVVTFNKEQQETPYYFRRSCYITISYIFLPLSVSLILYLCDNH